ncbi:unnamed protein product [Darwinula stevensoni]|uniref:Presequence protease, mitochondrial n=1 Tax=Darwinula stevensoni TaxID=69355 RepID=A0A7R9A4N3_9CRUS|nr:unnamed protein product [Darwinula stevensoni]CAG0884626.1 unnamed protein product [Darwinula stevensoni]
MSFTAQTVAYRNLLLLKRATLLWSPCRTLYKNPLARGRVDLDGVLGRFHPGIKFSGFTVQRAEKVSELHLAAILLSHDLTGAQYLHVAREDMNNVFSIGFRTTPMNSTGVAHILEHVTLCGSQNYPVRDPFFKMLNRSLATFMNAMTGADYTVYPFSTQNPVDFQNLMGVYMDAVLNPKLEELDFLQEGWRLEHSDVDDHQTPVVFKGVVFNEMKGAFADSQRLYEQKVLNSVLPSHTYKHISGGDPLEIPKLGYSDLIEFHRVHYHPSNAHIFTYGDLPLEYHLEELQNRYLCNYSKMDSDTSVPDEVRWIEPKRLELKGPPDPMAQNSEKQVTTSVTFLMSPINDCFHSLCFQILSELLTGSSNAPFYKSLLQPNIGSGFAPITGFDNSAKESFFSVGLQGIAEADINRVTSAIWETLEEVTRDGFPEERIDAILHSIELGLKHQTSNFGLGLILALTPFWNHVSDPIPALQVNHLVNDFRHSLKKNPQLLQDMVKEFMLNNKHHLITVMRPDEEYLEMLTSQEDTVLEDLTKDLTEKEKEKLFDTGKVLRDRQNQKEDFSCLPILHLSELELEIPKVNLQHEVLHGVPVQFCCQPTNGVTYFRAVINTRHLSPEELHLLPLFCEVVTKMGAGTWDYKQLDHEIELNTGGLSVCPHIVCCPVLECSFEQGILLHSFCLNKNFHNMLGIWLKIFRELQMNDTDRLMTLIRNAASHLVNSMAHMGHSYAMTLSASTLSAAGNLHEMMSGFAYVNMLNDIAHSDNISPVLKALVGMGRKILSKVHLRCAFNTTSEDLPVVKEAVEKFILNIPGTASELQEVFGLHEDFQPSTRHSHLVLPYPINFSALSIPIIPYTDRDFPALRVLSRLLTYKYLHREIRERGGAYGGGAAIHPTGMFTFYSYRDPLALSTFNTYHNSLEWILQGADFSEEDIHEAKLAVFQAEDKPVPPGMKGMDLFLHHLSPEMRNEHRHRLMGVAKDDLISVAEKHLKDKPLFGACLMGSELEETAKDPKWHLLRTKK